VALQPIERNRSATCQTTRDRYQVRTHKDLFCSLLKFYSFDALSVTSFRLRDYLAALIPQMSLLEIKFSCKSLEFDLLPFAISHIRQMIRTSPSLRSVTVTLPRITDPNVPDYTYWKWERKTTIDEITTSLAAHPVDRTPEDRRTETLVWEARDGTLFWDDQRQGDSFRRTP
jgi:hypothetical protein